METAKCLIRRLDADTDESLIREAVGWLDTQPQFYRDCDAAWGTEDADAYLRQMRTDPQADFGVFADGEFVGIITVSLASKQVYNSHLMVKRGTDAAVVATAVGSVITRMLNSGVMREGWMWLARKNYGVRRILESLGMRQDGLERIKGQSHNRPIEWVRYSVRAAA